MVNRSRINRSTALIRISRITVLIGIFTFVYAFLLNGLFGIQVKRGEKYQEQASFTHEIAGALTPKRGSIYFTDKDGSRIPAVINREYPYIYAVPKEVSAPKETAEVVSEITGADEKKVVKSLSKSNDPYERITRRVSDEVAKKIKDKNLKGVYIGTTPGRFYPLEKRASQLLGFTSIADSSISSGQYGVERYFDKKLRGIPGLTKGDKLIPPKNGEDIYLTIDRNIQVQAENILDKMVDEFDAVGGTVIVENPRTGKILAMASYPNFNPNDYGKFDIKMFLNPAVESVYEPGSIFKVITMSAGIDSGKITPNTTYYDTGSVTLNGRTIRNWDLRAYGKTTMTHVIERSINTGAVFAEKTTGNDIFYNYLIKFGLKEKKGIDLPGEIIGSLGQLENDPREINFATASFGQGISVTPIGLISAISAIANGGVLMRPYLDASASPEVIRRVISRDTSRKVIGMMVSAVDKAGVAKINGYSVAGKTGTAQVPNFKTGGYTKDVIDTYIGFVPAYDAQFIVLMRLDKPAGAPHAALTIVPAFRELAQFIINYYNIPPDDISG